MVAADTTTGLEFVRAEIARACRDAGRDPAEVTLVAVSKTFDAEAIEPVIAAGQRVFGENRVQEAKGKVAAIAWQSTPASNCISSVHCNRTRRKRRWRFSTPFIPSIGQACARRSRRKSKSKSVSRFCSSRSTPAPSRKRQASCRKMPMHFSQRAVDKYGLKISGLMCIPPLDEAPGAAFCAHSQDRQAQWPETCCRWA